MLLLIGSPLSASPQSSPEVRWDGTRLSVNAQKAPLSQVLNQVAVLTGLRLQGVEKVAEPVSVEFSNLPLGTGLETLLGGVDYALVGSSGRSGGNPGLLVIWGMHAGGPQVATRVRSGFSGKQVRTATPAELKSIQEAVKQVEDDPAATDQDKGVAEIQLAAAQVDYGELRKALSDVDPVISGNAFEALVQLDPGQALDALLGEAKTGSSASRLQALQFLDQAAWADPATVLSTLSDSLKDEDLTIRGFAIQALANRGGAEAMRLLDRALSDPDPNVRLMVVQGVSQNEAGYSLLKKAASDSDEMVSAMADQALESFTSSTK